MDSAAWDSRYAAHDLVWSADPNVWVADLVADLPPGHALDIAGGEGRHALWLASRGWTVLMTDFSPVAVARARSRIDAAGLASRATALVRDATQAVRGGGVDLVVIAYLHLPPQEWRAALTAAVEQTAVGGIVVIVGHALRNLTEGVGGPQDPAVLLDPDGVVASARGLPVAVERSEIRRRAVSVEPAHGGAAADEGGEPKQWALDTVVVLRRTGSEPVTGDGEAMT